MPFYWSEAVDLIHCIELLATYFDIFFRFLNSMLVAVCCSPFIVSIISFPPLFLPCHSFCLFPSLYISSYFISLALSLSVCLSLPVYLSLPVSLSVCVSLSLTHSLLIPLSLILLFYSAFRCVIFYIRSLNRNYSIFVPIQGTNRKSNWRASHVTVVEASYCMKPLAA